jgi:hypothetical protein
MKKIFIIVIIGLLIPVYGLTKKVEKTVKAVDEKAFTLIANTNSIEIAKGAVQAGKQVTMRVLDVTKPFIVLEPPLGPPIISDSTMIAVSLATKDLPLKEGESYKILAYHTNGKKVQLDGELKDGVITATVTNIQGKYGVMAIWQEGDVAKISTGLTDPFEYLTAAHVVKMKTDAALQAKSSETNPVIISPPVLKGNGFVAFEVIAVKP